MPLVRVALRSGKTTAYRAAVGDAIHRAMIATIDVPPDDRFQIFSEHAADALVFDPGYLGISRGEEFLAIQITLNSGRTVAKKKALYAAIVENLAKDPGIAQSDVLVNLVEVARENWSFGDGKMSYAPPE
jgi:phenylpyruvate tautomerase PptA (4-oxalocrotonate tautomerase family)